MEDLINKAFKPETFRSEAHQLVELLATELEKAHTAPQKKATINWESPAEQLAYWQNDFNSPLINNPQGLFRSVISRSVNLHSRGYIGHQTATTLPVTALTSALISFFNNGMAVYEMGMAGNAMEKVVTAHMAARFGFGEDASGIVTSGGTLGNLTALLAARAAMPNVLGKPEYGQLAIMVSEEAHYSIERAVRIMGLPPENIIKIPVNNRFQMRADTLEHYYQEAAAKGKKVFCIVGCACSTSIGAYDDLDAIGSFAQKHNIWFHVDGAHGTPVVFSPVYSHLLKGIEKADSVMVDFHKMMMAPSLSTAVLFKSARQAGKTFLQKAEYLWQDQQADEWYNSGKQTFECTKPMTILHTYTIMRLYGDQLYQQHIEKLYGMAAEFARMVQQHENFELACEPQSNIVCFRLKAGAESNELNRDVLQRLIEDGRFYIVGTTIKQEFYLRITLMNPLTQTDDLEQLLSVIEDLAMSDAVMG
ncbi:aminotransferase class I/II-fold pyridoxal phosphate-dependent enzyme [Mucilaginibacter sp. HC2]|uniref:pyridoxal phosphate-dependent decarboxylase family protein n=1 Tax=Mucilaginibacter inviolabilis TaxID=2714892 RepID=UPI00140C7781|nr:aminotransferase class I/II-fold pyridoxal phosphate-dependent enzyme [Mucilaginibacter inviolabilis]NHA04369.1 aminotransferase class I/II-fold pyridoxal phosphate-dependent enzyme [Mucilaginibacter inviolabilis]